MGRAAVEQIAAPADAWPGEPPAQEPPLQWEQLCGLEHLRPLEQFLPALRRAYAHPNRRLHLDQYVIVGLLGFFTPVLRSLRQIEDFTGLPQARRRLGLERCCRNSFSQASGLFEPRLLLPMIRSIRQQIPDLRGRDVSLGQLYDKLVAGDGSYFRSVAELCWTLSLGRPDRGLRGAFRLDLQLEVCTGLPLQWQISGQHDGSEILRQQQMLQSGKLYVFDRYYLCVGFLRKVVEAGSDLVVRAKRNPRQGPALEVLAERPLGEADQRYGICSDRTIRLTGTRWSGPGPQRPMREVILQRGQEEPVRLITSLVDVPAWMIGELYRKRWAIELFFRWFKCWAGYRRAMSRTPNGVLLQFYIAMLGCLLLCRASGRSPSKYAYSLLCAVAAGWGRAEEIWPVLARRERERALAHVRRARKRAAQSR